MATRHELEDVQDGADPAKEQKESDVSMERKWAMLQKMLKALMDEDLSALRPGELVAKQGLWMIQVLPRCDFLRGK